MVLIPEILAICFHSLSILLGLFLVKRHEDIFTRELSPKPHRYCVDFIEGVYVVVVLSIMTNLWFIYNQTMWMVEGYSKSLNPMVYLQWMWYHTGTGVVVSLLHLVIHWLLSNYKKTRTQVKTNWKL